MVTEIVIAIVSASISCLVTHLYYRQSLENQKIEFEKHITPLKAELNKLSVNNTLAVSTQQSLLRDKRINDACLGYRKNGNPRHIIDTYNDLTNDQKADMYDTVLIRERGRKGKSNPYR